MPTPKTRRIARAARTALVVAALASIPSGPLAVAADQATAPKAEVAANAQPPSAQAATDAASKSNAEAAPAQRAALLPDEAARTRDYPSTLERDESVWLDAGSDRSLALFRGVVHGEPRGVVLIVLARGLAPEQGSTSVALRHSLPRHGWATLLVRVPDGTSDAPDAPSAERAAIRSRLDAAIGVARQRAAGGAVIVFAEGEAAAWTIWAQRNGLGANAIAVVDVDAKMPTIESERPPEHLKATKGPALVLIETPHAWSLDDALSPEAELHLLPAANPSSERIERVLRGWIKRRLG